MNLHYIIKTHSRHTATCSSLEKFNSTIKINADLEKYQIYRNDDIFCTHFKEDCSMVRREFNTEMNGINKVDLQNLYYVGKVKLQSK